MKRKTNIILILTGAFLTGNLWSSEYPFTWVDYKGQKVKKWKISNEKYYSRAKKSKDTSKAIQSSGVELEIHYGLTGLDTIDKSNNSTAQIYSDSNLAVALKWEFRVNQWTHFIGSSFEKISFNQGNQSITDTDVSLLGLKLGSLYGDDYKVGGYIQYKQYPFLTTKDESFAIETATLPSLGVLYRDNLINGQKWSLDYGIFAEYITAGKLSNADTDAGIKSGVMVETNQKISNFDLLINLGVDYRSQGSSDIEQKQLDVKTGVGVKMEL